MIYNISGFVHDKNDNPNSSIYVELNEVLASSILRMVVTLSDSKGYFRFCCIEDQFIDSTSKEKHIQCVVRDEKFNIITRSTLVAFSKDTYNLIIFVIVP